ncbi:sulfotransferase [Salipiger sp. 1_MG-2023]|uniref:tetratricopeptide repeat-containing sulfotransferase family protein n=1 Tax=Salipiger sp. 1_MG-2023 TaxID=3062665 RepID=UPI0026E3ECF4|nr:sulfotransferase [Salipiger sp. 1_MG-2023]MDO6586160.1 sulfotransferase [Salipiger sp. 1_MG-2023]
MLPLSPQRLATLRQQAASAMARGQLAQAKTALQQIDLFDTTGADAPFHLSRIAYEEGDRDACLSHLRRAAQRAPGNAKLLIHAAERFRALGAADEALPLYDALAALPGQALKARADKAHTLQLLGRFDEAEAIFRKLIRAHPREAQLYRIFLAARKTPPGDPLLKAMEQLWARKDLAPDQRVHLGYALGKALDETGDPARAFACWSRANAAQREAAPFDLAAQDREFDAVIAAQSALPQGTASGAPAPIFVTGMPRSGTTLVERILSAHSRVGAGGELGHALRLSYQVFGAGEEMQPITDAAKMRAFAERYRRLARRDVPGESPVITDKSILSYLVIGLLHAAIPDARFVVVQRDPRDIALSIWRNHFVTGTHRYGNDLADLAHSIKRFRAIVAQWQAALPGVIHQIRYEDLVTDPEPQSRALIAAAGLEWQDACLAPQDSSAAVKTLSVAQVRQPIHAGRARGWQKYEQQLAPFIRAWGDDPWD